MHRFISSNSQLPHRRLWHVAQVHELRTDKTNTLLSSSLVTACTQQQLGGPWGHLLWQDKVNPPTHICKHCQKLLNH